jgi:hypothetical protein
MVTVYVCLFLKISIGLKNASIEKVTDISAIDHHPSCQTCAGEENAREVH